MNAVRIGCSGWQYDSWRGRLYPDREPKRRWLELYAQTFDTVEVNSTFYRLARRAAVEGWVTQTPSAFTFAVKASRYLTHIKRLRGLVRRHRGASTNGRAFDRGRPPRPSSLAAAGELPPRRRALHGRLAALPRGSTPSSFATRAGSCRRCSRCSAPRASRSRRDHPERPFQSDEATAIGVFIRFHYGYRGRRGNYSGREALGVGSVNRCRRTNGAVWGTSTTIGKGPPRERSRSLARSSARARRQSSEPDHNPHANEIVSSPPSSARDSHRHP